MKTKKTNNKIYKLYIKELNNSLICSSSLKKAFIKDLKQQLSGMEDEVLSTEDLHRKFGTPNDIAKGFENRDDIDRLKRAAKKYHRSKIVFWISLLLAFLAILISIIVICSNEDYHSETIINSYEKENNT